jgi:CubicO group peptidase (beta-lactamase class C family)
VAVAGMVFPGDEWEQSTPQEQGMNHESITQMDDLMKAAQANGVLIRNGYIVAEWNYGGKSYEQFEVQSISKAITSLVLGLAVTNGLIPSIDAKVKDFYPDFEGGPYVNEITFRHLVTMTSGMSIIYWHNYVDPCNIKPGTEHHYTNDQFTSLAQALTYLYGQELKEVLDKKVLGIINAKMDWSQDKNFTVRIDGEKEIPVNAGYAFTRWTARDLARVGWLYLNKGRWKENQIISENYVEESWTSIPFKINEFSKSSLMETDPKARADRESVLSKLHYGLGWWTIDGYEGWYMHGNGGQFCLVMPKYSLVMVKINNYNVKPYVDIQKFYPLLMQSLKK